MVYFCIQNLQKVFVNQTKSQATTERELPFHHTNRNLTTHSGAETSEA